MYSVPLISGSAAVNAFVNNLRALPNAAEAVRSLYYPIIYELFGLSALVIIPTVLPNLIHVNRIFGVFGTIVEQVPDGIVLALKYMEQNLSELPPFPPSIFHKTSNLRSLVLWGGKVSDGEVPAGALDKLEVLYLWNCDASLLRVLRTTRYVVLSLHT